MSSVRGFGSWTVCESNDRRHMLLVDPGTESNHFWRVSRKWRGPFPGGLVRRQRAVASFTSLRCDNESRPARARSSSQGRLSLTVTPVMRRTAARWQRYIWSLLAAPKPPQASLAYPKVGRIQDKYSDPITSLGSLR